MDADYNDIQTWHFKDLVKVFGAKEGTYRTYQIKTKEQVHNLFNDAQFNSADVLQFVELYIPKKDAPRALIMTADAAAQRNSKA
jgi:pyruvate decarboxylase